MTAWSLLTILRDHRLRCCRFLSMLYLPMFVCVDHLYVLLCSVYAFLNLMLVIVSFQVSGSRRLPCVPEIGDARQVGIKRARDELVYPDGGRHRLISFPASLCMVLGFIVVVASY